MTEGHYEVFDLHRVILKNADDGARVGGGNSYFSGVALLILLLKAKRSKGTPLLIMNSDAQGPSPSQTSLK